MNILLHYFIFFLNILEDSRHRIYEALSKWAAERDLVSSYLDKLESNFKGYHPFTIVIGFFLLFSLLKWFMKKLTKIWRSINSIEKLKICFINFALNFKAGRDKVAKTKAEIKAKVSEALKVNQFKKLEFRANGQDIRPILTKLSQMQDIDKVNIGGPNTKITGAIYINDSQIESLVSETVKMYGYSNLLHPDIFCSARFIEAQLIKLGIEFFNGDNDRTCGITTSGGSESILFACIAYRNRGYKMGIKHPEIIIPETAHAAFFKAGEAFNIKMVKVGLDKNYQVDIRKMERAINSNTVAIVGSFPNFPHGIYDDIEALSKIAVKHKVPLHVDACLGGLLIAFFQSANIEIPKFDFRLPGVTSISADFHKYGLCPKGISVLLYSDREYRKHQYFIYPHFMGGIYPSPGFEGSRSPAFAVAAYAVVIFVGKNRYINQAKAIYEAVKKIKNYIKKDLPELEVIGDPQICSVAVKGKLSLLIMDQMTSRGWHLNMINNPLGFSFVVTSANITNVENNCFFKDLKGSHDYVVEHKDTLKVNETTKMYGMSLDLPEPVVRENMDVMCDCMLD